MLQEFGVPAKSIPPRPYFRNAIAKNQTAWRALMRAEAMKMAQGRITMEVAMERVGLIMAGDVRQSIVDMNSPELSKVTLLLRKWKKEGIPIGGKTVGWAAYLVNLGLENVSGVSVKPLIDEGIMISTLTNAVE